MINGFNGLEILWAKIWLNGRVIKELRINQRIKLSIVAYILLY